MRSVAVAMLLMGSAFSVLAIVLLLRGASSAAGVSVIVPAMFLIASGTIAFSRSRG